MWQPKEALWNPPDLCGVLEKQGRKNGEWKPRYFILKGSNLFWFSTPTARSPKGVVPIEGAAVHTVRGSILLNEAQQYRSYKEGAPPVMFGIVSVLDQAYAATPGGRAELVMGASSPELQAVWAKALQAASISRPELLAKLNQKSKLTNPSAAEDRYDRPRSEAASSYAPPTSKSSRQTAASDFKRGGRAPCYSSPDQHEGMLNVQQQQYDLEMQAGLARSLSDTGGLSTYEGPPPSRSRESFAFPSMGAGMQSMPSSQEARLSQQNVHRLQAEFEESKFAGSGTHAPSTRTTAMKGHSGRGRSGTPPRSSRSPYRTPPRSAPRSATPPPRSTPRSDAGAFSTHSGPTYSPPSPHAMPNGGGGSGGGGKDHGKYPLRQMVRNFTDRVVGRVTPERRRGGTPERLPYSHGGGGDGDMRGGYENGAAGMYAGAVPSPRRGGGGGAMRGVNPAAAAGTVGGRLVHGIMANWADEEEQPPGHPPQSSHHSARRTPPASPHRSARAVSRSPPPSHYEGSTYHHEAGSNGGSAYNGGASRGEKSDRYAPPSSIPASSPANSVTGLPMRRAPPTSPSTHSSVAASPHRPHSSSPRSQQATPPHLLSQSQSGASTPTRSTRTGGMESPSGSTLGLPLSHDHLDQLSRQLRSAFMAVGNEGNGHGPLHSSCGSEAGDSSVGHGLRAGFQEQQSGADPGLESQQQDELALVQQQVSMAAKLLRAQADRLQNALGSSGLGHAGSPSASQQQQQQQLSRLCSEVTPDLRANPLAASLGGGSVDGGRSGAATPASSVTATQQGEEGRGFGTRRRADTLFFMNHFQSLQASLASVAAAAAGAQEQQHKQHSVARGSVANQPRPSMQAMQAPLQHYLTSVQQQLTKLQEHRTHMEKNEAASLNSAMEAVQQALGALNAGGGGGSLGGQSGGRTVSALAMSSPQTKPPSRLGSVPEEPFTAGAGDSLVGGGGRVEGPSVLSSRGAPSAMGGGARTDSIRQAADNLRTQVFQPNGSAAQQLSAQNQAQQQQVYASVQQQQQQQQQQLLAHSRPPSTMSMAPNQTGAAANTQSRHPSTMSMASNPGGTVNIQHSRPPSTMSMASHHGGAAPPSRPASTMSVASHQNGGYNAHSRQPSTMSVASQPGTGGGGGGGYGSVGGGGSVAAQSRQPSTMSMASQLSGGGGGAASTQSRHASVMSDASTALPMPPQEFGQLPLPTLPAQSFSQAPAKSSAPPSRGGTLGGGGGASMASVSSAGSPRTFSTSTTAVPSPAGGPPHSPRTMSTPTQQHPGPGMSNEFAAGATQRSPRTASQPVGHQRVLELQQQQPRARYSSMDWC